MFKVINLGVIWCANAFVNRDESTISNELTKIKDVNGCLFDRKVIETIDKGIYRDANTFIDRFGSKLYIDQLSTGIKAALDVYH